MSYLKNKKNRLKTKYSNILSKDFGIVLSESPTKTIVICNGGLCNAISHEMVHDIFNEFDNLEDVVMVPGKSYAFVKYLDDLSAERAFISINNQVIWSNIRGPVHLAYANEFNMAVLQQSVKFRNPPGLIVLSDFITEEEENFILNLVGFDNDEKFSSELKHRKVKHYGYEFKYSTNNVNLNKPIDPIPSELNFLWERLKEYKCGVEFDPDQLTINSYEPGQGIPPHVDTHSAFEGGIFSLSVLSHIVMEFKNRNGLTYNVLLKRRSLCIMLEESRYDWMHGITPRKSDLVPNNLGTSLTVQNRERRISLTFRKTRTGDCQCKYPQLCDTAMQKLLAKSIMSDMKNVSLKEEAALELESNYVHEVYDKIAGHFSETRHKPWPNVLKFVDSFEPGSILVDVGCGNGKYFSSQKVRFEIGCDSTQGLMNICRERGFECFSCNCMNIPIRDNSVDGCICIAVIHHLTTEERRRRAIEEIIRILRVGGKTLIYVWAKNQEVQGKKSSYLKQRNPKKGSDLQDCKFETVALNKFDQKLVLPVHNNRTNFDHNDLLVPWKLKKKETDSEEETSVFLRFYHVYEEDELKNDCLKMRNVQIVDYYYDQGNWCILLEKE